jgi:hypothetical protein
MTFGIIIKEGSGFKRHFNRATGCRYDTAREYYSDIKAKGLEPYDESKVKPYVPKKYDGVSEEAKRMMNSVSYDKKGKPIIGDRYIDKLKSMGMKKVPKEVATKSVGGWC